MGKDLIGYNKLLDRGLRSVVREAIRVAAEKGWPGDHHAYISFKTTAPGVEVADFLRERYPDEMTIVLQHQFWDLAVDDDAFEVTLSFNKLGQRLRVPFAALTAYADPTASFSLQFHPTKKAAKRTGPRAVGEAPEPPGKAGATPHAARDADAAEADGSDDGEDGGNDKVVALDRFRKK